MNTSFNLRGEAIVHTPTDAIRTFFSSVWMLWSSAVSWWRNRMKKSEGRMANMLLRYAAPLSGLRRVPILGGVLSWTSRRLVPPGTSIWVQIQRGPAQGLWIRVNPRTGQDVEKGIGEPAVQEAMPQPLHPGMTFYDLGANIGFFSLLAARIVGLPDESFPSKPTLRLPRGFARISPTTSSRMPALSKRPSGLNRRRFLSLGSTSTLHRIEAGDVSRR